MSNPRRRIPEQRAALVAPPRLSDKATAVPPATPSARAVRTENVTTIGKKQGRLRSVGLYLSAPDAEHLRAVASEHGVALGVALLHVLNRTFDTVFQPPCEDADGSRFKAATRPTTRRGLDRPSIVYVLLDPSEACAIKSAADVHRLSVSDLVGRCISSDAGEGIR